MSTALECTAHAASYEECVVRLTAAAHSTQRARKQLECIGEVLRCVTRCVDGVVAAAAAAEPTNEDEPRDDDTNNKQSGAATEPRQLVDFPCLSTDALWRAWRTTPEAGALFHHSGFSTSVSAFEKAVTRAVVHTCIPRVQRIEVGVQQMSAFLQLAGTRVLRDEALRVARQQWVVEAVTTLSMATHTSASALWENLEADLARLCVQDGVGEAAAASSECNGAALLDGRLAQQQQRLVKLLRDVVDVVATGTSPIESPKAA